MLLIQYNIQDCINIQNVYYQSPEMKNALLPGILNVEGTL